MDKKAIAELMRRETVIMETETAFDKWVVVVCLVVAVLLLIAF